MRSILRNLLQTISGVTNIREESLFPYGEHDYMASGIFQFSSNEEKEPYLMIYRDYQKGLTRAISFRLVFVFEDVKKDFDKAGENELTSLFNQLSIGIKVTPSEAQKDSGELIVGFNVEFFIPSTDDITTMYDIININLMHLESAPKTFSRFMKKQNIEHDYLND